MGTEIVTWSPQQIRETAEMIVRSRLFGVRSPEEAAVLMLVAQAEGEHPVRAMLDYYVVNGRPALRADAMLRRFLAVGGRVEWHVLTDERAEATFSHPQGGSVRIAWTRADAARAGLASEAWKKYPRQMLRARVLSEGIRTIFPVSGVYTPEEAQDMPPPVPAQPVEPVEPVEAVGVEEVREALPEPPGPEPETDASQELITEAQLRKLWAVAKKRLGLEGASRQEASQLVHQVVSDILGREVDSVRHLTRGEASRVIDELGRRSW